MKKLMMTLIAMVMLTGSAQAMSYEQAREQALFLTDKMAYELNLTEDQYEAAYEVNLDYLLGVETQADLYGDYWMRRNLDLSYILLDWQYNAFCAASYFYRPLYWDAGFWHFGIYARYPHRTYFYFGRPNFWYSYRGGHAWHHNGGHSWYHGREFGRVHRVARDHRGFGMRNGFDRGDFRGRTGNFENRNRIGGVNRSNSDVNRRGSSVNRSGNRVYRNNSTRQSDGVYNRSSSTRQTVGRGTMRSDNSRTGFGNSRTSMNRSRSGMQMNRSGNTSGSYNRSNSTRSSSASPGRSFSPSRSSSSSSSVRSSAPSSHSSSSAGGSHSSGSHGSSHHGGGRR